MRVLVTTFSHYRNKKYYQICAKHIANAGKYFEKANLKVEIYLRVIDFSPIASFDPHMYVEDPNLPIPEDVILRRPGAGFGDNLNHVFDIAISEKMDYLVCLNDDSFIAEDFILKGMMELDHVPKAIFIGGVPQLPGSWKDDLSSYKIPEPRPRTEQIFSYTRLYWEASACVFRVPMLEESGIKFDTTFDHFLGLCGDNDLLLRFEKSGYENWRSWRMRFWHARGVTQELYGRNPFVKKDPVRDGAVDLFKYKWGVDISDHSKLVTSKDVYDKPFRGKS